MNTAQRGTKTSMDVLRERDALRARLEEADGVLGAIEAEISRSIDHPEVRALALYRIAELVARVKTPRASAP